MMATDKCDVHQSNFAYKESSCTGAYKSNEKPIIGIKIKKQHVMNGWLCSLGSHTK